MRRAKPDHVAEEIARLEANGLSPADAAELANDPAWLTRPSIAEEMDRAERRARADA